METDNILEPGIHYNVPFEKYLKLKGVDGEPLVSASAIRGALEGSLLRMRGIATGQVSGGDTPDRTLGSQLHCWVLEGEEEFRKRHSIASSCSAIVKSGENAGMPCMNSGQKQDASGAWFCGTHGRNLPDADATRFITEADLERIRKTAEALRSRPCFRVLRLGGMPEVTWVAEICGVMCKGRLDFYRDSGGRIVVDIKKHDRTPISSQSAVRTISNNDYRIQAQFYRMGVEAITGEAPVFWWILAESQPMFDAVHVQLEEKDAYYAANIVRIVLEKYRECLSTGHFPGAHDSARPLLSESAAWKNKQLILGENIEPDDIGELSDEDAINASAYPY